MKTGVAVVVVNWNKAARTAECLSALQRILTAPATLICVDNGSSEPMPDLGSEIVLIRNAVNAGFTGGVNVGLAYAFANGADYVWLLNNDAEPLPGALDALIDAARADAAVGLASSVILNSDDNDAVDFHGGRWDARGDFQTTASAAEYQAWASAEPRSIWLVGTALLVARRLVERIGYFDDDLFAYFEDNDICRRSAAAGFHNVVVSASLVRHECGTGPGARLARAPYYFYYMARNEILVLRKHGGILASSRPLYWALRRQLRMRRRLSGYPAQRRAMWKGVIDGYFGRTGKMPEP